MPDPSNIAIEENDNLNPIEKAAIIEKHEAYKAEKEAEKQAEKDAKEAATKQEYEDLHGHEPIDPLSF